MCELRSYHCIEVCHERALDAFGGKLRFIIRRQRAHRGLYLTECPPENDPRSGVDEVYRIRCKFRVCRLAAGGLAAEIGFEIASDVGLRVTLQIHEKFQFYGR